MSADEWHIMDASNVSVDFLIAITGALLAKARELGYTDVVVRPSPNGGMSFVAVKK